MLHELTGEQYKELVKVLESAFPSKKKLEHMFQFCLGENLHGVVSNGNLREQIFEVVQVAQAEGWVKELIQAAIKCNPNNPMLKRFIKNSTDTPYKGLDAFKKEDKDYFFGRQNFVENLIRIIKEKPFVTLIGNSGSGKSSVVFAGLVPKLEDENWLVVDLKPRKEPFNELSATLAKYTENTLSIKDYAEAFRREDLKLFNEIEFIITKHNKPLLLVIDQLEELFTLSNIQKDKNLQKDFLKRLIEITQKDLKNFRLFLTMRSDFMSHALGQPEFGQALNESMVTLTAMKRERLQEVIEKPALKLGVGFEHGLADTILDDVMTSANQKGVAERLPLLEFALTQLWRKRVGQTITLSDYRNINQVEGALATHAERIYKTFSKEEQEKIKRIFTQLVRPGEGTEDTRQVSTKKQIGEEDWSLVKKLGSERLVTISHKNIGEEAVEIVHETLIWSWQRFSEWIDTSREFIIWQNNLNYRVTQWEIENEGKYMLLGRRELPKAKEYLKSKKIEGVSKKYIEKSIEERKRKRRNTFLSVGILILFVLALLTFPTWFPLLTYAWKTEKVRIEDSSIEEILRRTLKIGEDELLTNGHLLVIRSIELNDQEDVNRLIKPFEDTQNSVGFERGQNNLDIEGEGSNRACLSSQSTSKQLHTSFSEINSSDNSFLKAFTKIGTFYHSITKTEDINKLSELPNLQTLYLSGKQINDISSLSELPNLRELHLSDTEVTCGLSGLKNLQILSLSGIQASRIKIEDLSKLTNLKRLNLDLKNMQEVDLQYLSELGHQNYLGIKKARYVGLAL